MQSLSERTAGFTDSVIRRMTRVSMQYGAVNLSQGFPDFEPPKEILDRMAQVAYEDFHQYSITWGSQNFREALAAKQSRCMGRKIDPNTEIVTTCGSTEAMMAAMMTVTNPGDKVIIFSPFYENYGADTILSGAEPIYVPLVPPDFHFDPAVLEDAFRQHPKAMILCNPSNPCGKVFRRDELEAIAKLAIQYDAFVVTDEVYEPLYDLAKAYKKPVAIHMGQTAGSRAYLKYSHPLTLDEAAVRHPDVNFVMCHFGNPWLLDAAAVVEKNENVMTDLSGLLEGKIDFPKLLEQQRGYFDALKTWISYCSQYEKFMFGTDWPLANYGDYIEVVKWLIPEEKWGKVFYENAKRIYGL